MRSIDLNPLDPAVRLAGILHAFPRGDGLGLGRIREEAVAQIVDPVLLWTASCPSGGRIEFTSNTTAVEVDLQLTRLAFGDDPAPDVGVDLVVDGTLTAGRRATEGHTFRFTDRTRSELDIEGGPPVTVRFDAADGLGGTDRRVEIWLPASCSVDLLAIRIDDDATLTPTEPHGRRWIHYGSSISHCMEADRPTGVWPVIAARTAGVDLLSLAVAGQAQLDQFAARTIRDQPADLISLKLGINIVNADSMRERTFVPAVHGFLDTIRDGHPTTPLLVITPILCPVAEDHPGPTWSDLTGTCRVIDRPRSLAEGSLTVGRIRELLALIIETRQQAGDANLHLLDGRTLFGEADLDDLPDGLHPNADGYARMGERFHATAFTPGNVFSG